MAITLTVGNEDFSGIGRGTYSMVRDAISDFLREHKSWAETEENEKDSDALAVFENSCEGGYVIPCDVCKRLYAMITSEYDGVSFVEWFYENDKEDTWDYLPFQSYACGTNWPGSHRWLNGIYNVEGTASMSYRDFDILRDLNSTSHYAQTFATDCVNNGFLVNGGFNGTLPAYNFDCEVQGENMGAVHCVLHALARAAILGVDLTVN